MRFPADLEARYVNEGVHGRGGMGIVFRATHRDLGRPVAIKILRPNVAHNEECRNRFLLEGRLAARVRHPNVVLVLEAGATESGVLYIAYEFLRGEDLATGLGRRGRFDWLSATMLTARVLSGIGAIHEAGILHRDIKLANIIVVESGEPKILDFGIARETIGRVQRTQSGQIVGTPEYIAPEIIKGEKASVASDLYAVGAALYALVTGRPPFIGDTFVQVLEQQVNAAPPDPSRFAKGLPTELRALLMRVLEKDPSRRPQSAAEFAQALDDFRTCSSSRTRREPLSGVVPVRGPTRKEATVAVSPVEPVSEGRTMVQLQPWSRSRRLSAAVAALLVLLGAQAWLRSIGPPAQPLPTVTQRPPSRSPVAPSRPANEVWLRAFDRFEGATGPFLARLTSFSDRWPGTARASRERLGLILAILQPLEPLSPPAPSVDPARVERVLDMASLVTHLGLAELVTCQAATDEAGAVRQRLLRVAANLRTCHVALHRPTATREPTPEQEAAALRALERVEEVARQGRWPPGSDGVLDEAVAHLEHLRVGLPPRAGWGRISKAGSLATRVRLLTKHVKARKGTTERGKTMLDLVLRWVDSQESVSESDPVFWELRQLLCKAELSRPVPDHVFTRWLSALLATIQQPPGSLKGLETFEEPVRQMAFRLAAIVGPREALAVYSEDFEGRSEQHGDSMHARIRYYSRLSSRLAKGRNHLLPLAGIAYLDLLLRRLEPVRPEGSGASFDWGLHELACLRQAVDLGVLVGRVRDDALRLDQQRMLQVAKPLLDQARDETLVVGPYQDVMIRIIDGLPETLTLIEPFVTGSVTLTEPAPRVGRSPSPR